LLLDRRWRALAGLGAAAVLLAAITLALSVPATLAYLALGHSFATMLGERGFPTAKMHSLYSFFVLLLPGHLTAAAVLTLLSSLAVLAVVRLRQPPYAVDTLDQWYATAIWGTVLVSPHVPFYDLSLLVLPALLVRSGTEDEALWRGGIAAAWAATILSQPLAELTRAAGGARRQLSVPVLAGAGGRVPAACRRAVRGCGGAAHEGGVVERRRGRASPAAGGLVADQEVEVQVGDLLRVARAQPAVERDRRLGGERGERVLRPVEVHDQLPSKVSIGHVLQGVDGSAAPVHPQRARLHGEDREQDERDRPGRTEQQTDRARRRRRRVRAHGCGLLEAAPETIQMKRQPEAREDAEERRVGRGEEGR